MIVSMIAARGKNNEIGAKGDLLWHISSDLKFFKSKTMGKSIIMGRKTFESLPKALPGRKNIVLTTNETYEPEGAVPVFSTREALEEAETEEVFIIGGGSVYEKFMPMATRLYITEVDFESSEADAFFPDTDLSGWESTVLDEGEENSLKFRHILYERKSI